jgi:transcriptional regulator with XRE-family HTH domain
MELLTQFGIGLQQARRKVGKTQEDFSNVSSRTYLSSLERGKKAPTITKIEQIASELGVHPLTLFALAFLVEDPGSQERLLSEISLQLSVILQGVSADA